MGLTKCPDCGREVSQDAWACPGCGKPFRSLRIGGKIFKSAALLWLVLIVAFIVIRQLLGR
jgi:hypothetical protein